MKNQWDQFGIAYETFSVWISDKEKQLEVLKSSALPLEQQISTVKVQCCLHSRPMHCHSFLSVLNNLNGHSALTQMLRCASPPCASRLLLQSFASGQRFLHSWRSVPRTWSSLYHQGRQLASRPV